MAFGILGDIAGLAGTRETNSTNRALASEAHHFNRAEALAGRQHATNERNQTQAFNSDQARQNRSFQERLSNTAMQRQVQDYERAGINPLLGIAGGGSSTPGGAQGSSSPGASPSATGNTAAVMQNAFEGLGDSARNSYRLGLEKKKLNQELKNMKEGEKQTKELTRQAATQAALNKSLSNKAKVDAKVNSKGIPEADITNKLYNFFDSKVRDLKKSWDQSTSAKPNNPTLDAYMRRKRGGQP